jgi:hypothetical protein
VRDLTSWRNRNETIDGGGRACGGRSSNGGAAAFSSGGKLKLGASGCNGSLRTKLRASGNDRPEADQCRSRGPSSCSERKPEQSARGPKQGLATYLAKFYRTDCQHTLDATTLHTARSQHRDARLGVSLTTRPSSRSILSATATRSPEVKSLGAFLILPRELC